MGLQSLETRVDTGVGRTILGTPLGHTPGSRPRLPPGPGVETKFLFVLAGLTTADLPVPGPGTLGSTDVLEPFTEPKHLRVKGIHILPGPDRETRPSDDTLPIPQLALRPDSHLVSTRVSPDPPDGYPTVPGGRPSVDARAPPSSLLSPLPRPTPEGGRACRKGRSHGPTPL